MNYDYLIAGVAFVCIWIVLYLLNIKKTTAILKNKRNKKNKETIITEYKYLCSKFGINIKNLLNKKMAIVISFIDAFIITVVFLIIMLIPLKMMWQLLIGFVLLFGLIYSIYEILGRMLVKKGYKE